ncbi:DeoR/GlpR family DNA-binding transcription regulator [Sinorhizobium sp. BG8]|uniref:DeoR/GlpR family DNA-binding transcription regulator n=1 Tax=Sinorhizobium sp. BG8 TaxID=2613773 RepID=UPI00193D5D69|nr:DeoR/GlpR family DNA-binding transcription regulator [Sinorhizobium sp. BG8]QRM54636.1 DeoR/GlpR transcriptional regulator [Sinorhizobium sp. BG8]
MLTEQRKALITQRLDRDGEIVAKALASELGLSEDTIRRDLRELAAEGRLKRVHGGALPMSPALPDLTARQTVATEEKQALARRAAALIEPRQVVFLDGGTTTAEIARALPRHFIFTVVTHSPTIACELERHPTAEVVLIGGKLFTHSMVAMGAAALAAIRALRADIFFMGVTAAHTAEGFSTGDMEEAATKRTIAENSAATYVLLTQAKLNAASPWKIMPITAADGIIVPPGLPAGTLDPYRSLDIEIIEA